MWGQIFSWLNQRNCDLDPKAAQHCNPTEVSGSVSEVQQQYYIANKC